jgi:hypothetical protein
MPGQQQLPGSAKRRRPEETRLRDRVKGVTLDNSLCHAAITRLLDSRREPVPRKSVYPPGRFPGSSSGLSCASTSMVMSSNLSTLALSLNRQASKVIIPARWNLQPTRSGAGLLRSPATAGTSPVCQPCAGLNMRFLGYGRRERPRRGPGIAEP